MDQKETKAASLRERLEQHRVNAVCASCRSKIDSMEFAFENDDAVGAFRKTEGKKAIAVSETLPAGQMNGVGDLKKALLEEKQKIARHVAEKMLTYAPGRLRLSMLGRIDVRVPFLGDSTGSLRGL